MNNGIITVAGREIGPERPVYVVAELSANHNQSFDRAVQLVEAAKHAGADAVKLQTYTPDTMTIDCSNDYFRIGPGSIWEGQSLYELYSEAATPWEWHSDLKARAEALGLDFFSTPFDSTAVEFLEDLGVPAYKVASFEITDLPLIRTIAATGKPIILSSGMASEEEIRQAVTTARNGGASGLALLRCTSAYPAKSSEADLRTIPDFAQRFNVVPGLSDHTLEIAVPVAAVALGACIIEKHLTLCRNGPGPDATFSLEPDEFSKMVAAVRTVQTALGEVRYGPREGELASIVFRRSLFVVEDVAQGEELTRRNVRIIRPGHGLPPAEIDRVVGRRARRDLSRGTPLSWSDLDDK